MNRRLLWSGIVGLIVAGLALTAVIAYEPSIAPIAPPEPSGFDTGLKQEGARIVALGDCVVCHTANGGRPFAGGLPLRTPFGTIYATNITPDAETGIGKWSEAAFMRAVRYGISRDGHQLYPAFPYVHFTRMSDHDISAAYAYLMSREPVHARTPANHLIFPLNFRPFVAFWNVLFLHPGPRKTDAAQDTQWSRGKLIVDGLGHCASCHSPLNAIGAEEAGHAFDGGIVDGWEAPALNALGRAAQPWTKEQLVMYLRTGRASQHGAAAGPMRPVTRDLATVPESDVEAIAIYILSLQKASLPAPKADSVHQVADSEQRGAILFNASCAQCHGAGSPMQSIGQRPTLAFSSAIDAGTPRNAVQTILNGINWHGEDATNYMPSFIHIYDDRQIADLASYLRSTYSNKPAWLEIEPMVAKLRKEDSAP
ncbi:c-type cytochrome [Trinickia sp. NRRL B-1857]|uniref:cytochrome c n=1 Tax=Trinickia sp. NRRL B-1857 TaxID=3162879 RepID=UPI003D299B82